MYGSRPGNIKYRDKRFVMTQIPVKRELRDRLNAVARHAGKTIPDLFDAVMTRFIEAYEKKLLNRNPIDEIEIG